jgi:hypothetical protein
MAPEKPVDETGNNRPVPTFARAGAEVAGAVARAAAKCRKALLREGSMAGMFFGGLVTTVSMGTALFGGIVPAGAVGSDVLSLGLAIATAITVASASALDG